MATARYKEITTKHAANCVRCAAAVDAGQVALWDAQTKTLFCVSCGQELFNAGGLFGAPPVAES